MLLAAGIRVTSDPGTFFSTAALLMGVLVTIVGAALAQVLLDVDRAAEATDRGRKRLTLTVLAVVALADLWGVGFPFWALYRSALGPVSASFVTAVFVSTVVAGIANIVLPVYIVSAVRSARHWLKFFRLILLQGSERAAEIRRLVVDGKYIDATQYDELTQRLVHKTLDYASAVTLFEGVSKALVVGKPKGIGSPFRATMYIYIRAMIPAYARHFAARTADSADADEAGWDPG